MSLLRAPELTLVALALYLPELRALEPVWRLPRPDSLSLKLKKKEDAQRELTNLGSN